MLYTDCNNFQWDTLYNLRYVLEVSESYGSQPENSKSSANKSQPENIDVENDNRPIVEKYNLKLDLALGRSDDRMRYLLFDNIIVGDKFVHLTELYKTCLATQSSLDKIASIIESSLHWGKYDNRLLF